MCFSTGESAQKPLPPLWLIKEAFIWGWSDASHCQIDATRCTKADVSPLAVYFCASVSAQCSCKVKCSFQMLLSGPISLASSSFFLWWFFFFFLLLWLFSTKLWNLDFTQHLLPRFLYTFAVSWRHTHTHKCPHSVVLTGTNTHTHMVFSLKWLLTLVHHPSTLLHYSVSRWSSSLPASIYRVSGVGFNCSAVHTLSNITRVFLEVRWSRRANVANSSGGKKSAVQ